VIKLLELVQLVHQDSLDHQLVVLALAIALEFAIQQLEIVLHVKLAFMDYNVKVHVLLIARLVI